ncbi:uncharacterized protein [Procambarus clarkii]|uniref:uncharacterized protein n=1 Tax=Procambarus clarkii TaxID=6728 RepID=UPI0037442C46
MANIPQFPAFDPDCDQTNLSQRWVKWLKRFENLLIVSDIKSAEGKRAFLLHYADDRVCDIFDTLKDTGGAKDYDIAKAKLTEHFKPRQNTAMEIMHFRRARQLSNETVDQYHTRLQGLAAHCEFADVDKEIKQQIIETCTSTRLRRRALELVDDDSSLTKILDMACRMEDAAHDARVMECSANNGSATVTNSHEVCKVQGGHRDQRYHAKPNIKLSRKPHHNWSHGTRLASEGVNNKCYNCGGDYPHQGSCGPLLESSDTEAFLPFTSEMEMNRLYQ